MAILIVIISFIPSILFYFFLRSLKKDNEQYKKDCRKTLIRGFFAAIPIFLLDLVISLILSLTGIKDTAGPIVNTLIRCFIINAFVEELVKVWTGNKMIKQNHDTVSWLDMISFIAIASIGFEISEGIVYILTSSPGQMLVRGISMMHISFGLIEGWYIGKYAKTGDKKYMFLSMGVTILIHGLYNFGLSDAAPEVFGVFSLAAAAASAVFWIYMIFYIRKRNTNPEFSSPIYGTLQEEPVTE